MYTEFKSIIGMTFTSVKQTEKWGSDCIEFVCSDGRIFNMYHNQNCCENVYIESITGDLSDLENSPITFADKSSNLTQTEYGDQEWTFYKIATIKGWVDLRWNGSSNGYYSTSVSFSEQD